MGNLTPFLVCLIPLVLFLAVLVLPVLTRRGGSLDVYARHEAKVKKAEAKKRKVVLGSPAKLTPTKIVFFPSPVVQEEKPKAVPVVQAKDRKSVV